MTGSLDIPLLIGSNRTEWENFSDIVNVAVTQYDNLNNWSNEKVERGPDRKYGAKKRKWLKPSLRRIRKSADVTRTLSTP